MNFSGKKVCIRAIEREDLKILGDFHNNPDIAASIEFAWPISMEHQERFFQRISIDDLSKRLVITLPKGEVIGYTGYWGIDWINRRATTGIVIGRKDLHRKGYGTDAVMTIMRVAFEELGFHRLDAQIYEFNTASRKLYLGRCGWTEEGRRREHVFRNGRFWDTVLIGITASEYKRMAEATQYWGEQ